MNLILKLKLKLKKLRIAYLLISRYKVIYVPELGFIGIYQATSWFLLTLASLLALIYTH